ncbi:uncharacterized protein MICPUCDRAFT_61348 [Micromonas pusilla CCMP1545]|uniref:Predicted protein n=1 Tax=Micromonas pusilla (strain CCMP1545) TaxID=564608 RepID=C1MHH6_MICPC|nr:uncharacterized protein MICPUCDRAFT_61348 [Micromonas pusilla CCMP1545]EEH60747.1 predicted protein [Micromonas pusilla CCMP1545]|eukprot:XP_003055495.1 predicted protein [Micromonas pusilla CCMP1545]
MAIVRHFPPADLPDAWRLTPFGLFGLRGLPTLPDPRPSSFLSVETVRSSARIFFLAALSSRVSSSVCFAFLWCERAADSRFLRCRSSALSSFSSSVSMSTSPFFLRPFFFGGSVMTGSSAAAPRPRRLLRRRDPAAAEHRARGRLERHRRRERRLDVAAAAAAAAASLVRHQEL